MVNYLPFNKFLNTVVSYQNHIFIKHYTVYRGCLSQQYWLSNNCSLMKSLKMGQSFNFANKYNFYMFLFINLIYTSYFNMVLEQASQSKKTQNNPIFCSKTVIYQIVHLHDIMQFFIMTSLGWQPFTYLFSK